MTKFVLGLQMINGIKKKKKGDRQTEKGKYRETEKEIYKDMDR